MLGYVKIKTGKTALVLTYFIAVNINNGFVIYSAEIQQIVLVALLFEGKVFVVPHCTFIKVQMVFLRIPVAGDGDLVSSIKVILQ